MAWSTALASVVAGGCGGLLSGLFGIGGGLVLIPLLGLLLGLNQHQAQGVTLAAMLLPSGLPAVLHLRKQGIRTPWGLVAQLTAGFLLAIWVGARIANRIPEQPLRWGFACILLAMAARSLWAQKAAGQDSTLAPRPPSGAGHSTWRSAVAIGMAGGLASGLLGIGGGILMIPLMVWRLGLSQHEAQAASLTLMLAPIGLPGVWVYAQHGPGFLWVPMAGVALGFLAGAYGGARIATRIHGPRLRQGFALLMAAMAGLLLLRDF